MNRATAGPSCLVSVFCQIDAADIESMEYWLNEAPMADPAQSNAIVFALRRFTRADLPVRLESGPAGDLSARIGAEQVPLPREWAVWWDNARQGRRVSPLAQTLLLPIHLLASPAAILPSRNSQPRLRRREIHAA